MPKMRKIGESIEHIMAGCPVLLEAAYLGRHNQVAKLVHQHLSLTHELIEKSTTTYYKYSPQEVLESADYLLYWDRPILTDKTVDFNRPDLIVINKKEKSAMIIDVAVPLSSSSFV